MKINVIIVEDEPLALERVKGFVLKLPYLHLLASFDNAFEALTFLSNNKVDLIFLDIHMDEFSGIQLLETSAVNCEVIITTAYHEYALKGFELQVSDYLLKPYTFERFVKAVERVRNNLLKTETVIEKKYIFIKTEYRLEKVLLNEILYIEGMRDYRKIHSINKQIMTLQTFTDFEKDIPPNVICRVHKSFMVSIDKIDSVEKDTIKIKGIQIPISDTYKQLFYDQINFSAK